MISFFKFQGKDISALTLGLMTNIDVKHESEKLKLYTQAYDFGINSFDSSPNYQNGYSDVFLGKLVKQIGRENVFISNKVFFANPYSDFSNTLKSSHIISTVEGSLMSIGTDCLDCLILHRFDFSTPIIESLEAIELLLNQGKIKSWGVSAFSIEQLLDYVHVSKQLGINPPIIGQYAYNFFNRSIEKDLNSVALNKGMNLFTYYPLAQGVLTGKYSGKTYNSRADDIEFRKNMWDLTDTKIKKAQLFHEFCKNENLDAVSVAYLWCLRNSNVVSLITNVRDIKQLYQNIKFTKSSLSMEILTNLDHIFNNSPVNQYTNIKYEITKRKL